jgi:anaerobic selenocysteine-containing dehydrogenase
VSTTFATCNLCEAMCGIAVSVEDGQITSIRGDRDDPFSRGHICPKAYALKEVYEDPDRLRRPMRRTTRGWEPVSWKDALDEAARRIDDLRRQHGRNAVGVYLGNPTVHGHGISVGVQGFVRALGSRSRFDANSQDANPKLLAAMLMYGDQLAITIPDVDRTDYLLILGGNPAASNGSLMTLGDPKGRLAGVRERGGKIVLVDPRRTETAKACDEHHFIRPGGDAALLLALLHVILPEKKLDHENVDRLREIAARFPPERVADAIGVPAATIRKIASDFASARRAVAYGRVGLCTNEHGAVASWLVEALNVVTGNFDREGGAMFSRPAVDLPRLGRKLAKQSFGRWRSRVRGIAEFGGQLPGSVMAEEMETPGDGQIRGFVTIAGNPVLSTPDGERLARALAKLDFMVSVDYYLNETTRHAHLVLPGTHALERGHYDAVFHTLAVRNTVKWSPPVMTPEDGALEDWEILYELAMRLGGIKLGVPIIDRAARLAWRAGLRVSPDRLVDLAMRIGPYGLGRGGLSLAKVKRAPHGIDLGPLVPRREPTKVDLAPALLVGEIARVERWLAERPDGLVLIGRRHLRTNNSWMHNCPSLVKGPDRATLLMHPDDAAALGLAAGAEVRVKSNVGEVACRLELSGDVMRGVVSLPHGYGHAASAPHMRVAGATPGPNINALTDPQTVEPLIGTAILNGVPVTVHAS